MDLPTRLWVGERDDELAIDYWGSPFDAIFEEMLSLAGNASVAPRLRSFSIAGPDDGSNGTRNWDLQPWLAARSSFDRLRHVEIEGTRPEHHNRTIVAAAYDEGGVLGRLVDRAPCLEVLISPSAPSPALFRRGPHPLRRLAVDVGFDHQGFVGALATSTRFASLQDIEIGEYAETYMDDFAASCIPIEHYRALFGCTGLPAWRSLRWKNPVFGDDLVHELARGRPNLRIEIVRSALVHIDVGECGR